MKNGQEYFVRRWFDQVTVSAGWIDLVPERLALTREDDLLAAQIRYRSEQLAAQVVAQGTIRFNEWTGVEVTLTDSSGVTTVERYYVVTRNRPRPRLYLLSASGKRLSADGPVAQTLFQSFTVLPPE